VGLEGQGIHRSRAGMCDVSVRETSCGNIGGWRSKFQIPCWCFPLGEYEDELTAGCSTTSVQSEMLLVEECGGQLDYVSQRLQDPDG